MIGQEVYKKKRKGYPGFTRSSLGIITHLAFTTCIIYDNPSYDLRPIAEITSS
jgi:hypothetical protein